MNASAPSGNASFDEDANYGEAEPFNYSESEDDSFLFPTEESFKTFVNSFFNTPNEDAELMDNIFSNIARNYVQRDLTPAQRESILEDLRALRCSLLPGVINDLALRLSLPTETIRAAMQIGGRRRKSRKNKSRRTNRKMRKTRRH
jgi:hypothetical protein